MSTRPTERITSAEEAASILRDGGLVAFPTETVFGLGVDATNEAAVQKLFAAKGRPSDNPLIVHVGRVGDWSLAAERLTPSAEALLDAFAPGPLTVVLPKRSTISPLVTAGLQTVGVRVPNHPVAAEVLRLAGVPIAAPSANRSGRPSCTKWQSVLEDLDGLIDAVFCEDSHGLGIESTVVDCTRSDPLVLRHGGVSLEQLREVCPGTREASAADKQADVRSPGLLHPHYQPKATVRLVESPPTSGQVADGRAAYCGITPPESNVELAFTAVYQTVGDYAASFYEFLREADRRGAETIFVQQAPAGGIGTALQDRQRRAAGG